jgi:L-aminopeptidase/D-esterase-like protein
MKIETISINDIAGFRIGQAENARAATGCTVIACEEGAICGVEVRGGSPGTLDTDALDTTRNRPFTHAVLLSGGSAFGLASAGGVMRFLEEQGIGRDMGTARVPAVAGAILFDLKCGSAKIRPDAAMGYAACENAWAGTPFQSGNHGAGCGALVGKLWGFERGMKSGIGSAAFRLGGLEVGAIMAVNCIGDVLEKGRIIAGALTEDRTRFSPGEEALLEALPDVPPEGNTIIGCVITNAGLNKDMATRLAGLTHNGIARVIRPAHTMFDGDTMFALCCGRVEAQVDAVGILACRAVEAAVIDAVKSAKSAFGFISYRDFRAAALQDEAR